MSGHKSHTSFKKGQYAKSGEHGVQAVFHTGSALALAYCGAKLGTSSFSLARAKIRAKKGQFKIIKHHGNVAGREVVTVATPEGPRAMHLRTGEGKKAKGRLIAAGEWERFDGFLSEGGNYGRSVQGDVYASLPEGWFIKPDCRCPTPNDMAASQWLAGQKITRGASKKYQAVQSELETLGVPVLDPTNPSSGWTKF